jgi:hypothetical protein
MRKLSFLAIFSLALLITVSLAFAAATPFTLNLVGKWQGTVSRVVYDPTSHSVSYPAAESLTISILNQQGDRFNGTVTRGTTTSPFTGVISQGKAIATAKNAVITIDMPFYEASYWRMAGHYQNSDSSGYNETGKFMVHRTSTTP